MVQHYSPTYGINSSYRGKKRNKTIILFEGEETKWNLLNPIVSHEIVRHRVASYAQESTRYCTYGANAKRPNEITFIIPAHLYNELSEGAYEIAGGDLYVNNQEALLNGATHVFIDSLFDAERNYNDLIARGWVAQQARAVLPNALKTEIVMTANLREWMHFLNLRSKGITGAPHPDMKVVADMIYENFHQELPEIFQ